MQIETTHDTASNTTSLTLSGRFDAHETDSFRETFDGLNADGVHNISVGLAEVEFLDSTALAELVRGMKRCRENGGDLVLDSLSDPVRVILELTKLDAAFTIN